MTSFDFKVIRSLKFEETWKYVKSLWYQIKLVWLIMYNCYNLVEINAPDFTFLSYIE